MEITGGSPQIFSYVTNMVHWQVLGMQHHALQHNNTQHGQRNALTDCTT
jgi:hypothetical protein